MSDTPKTDAFREVIFAQYKEDELTGDGMGNILAALTNIETLERKRECECKCDVDWPEEYYELRQRLERERDEALAYADKLAAGLPEGMLPKDVEVLRDANLALAVALEELNSINAERAAHRGTRKAWIELDDKRQILEKQLTSERALADRLAADLNDLWHHYSQTEASYEVIDEALSAWKEARHD